MLSDIILKKGTERDKQHYSFVGIERNKMNGKLEFWLPLGFENFPEDDFISLKNFFFKMYRTFSIYIKKKEYRELEEGKERDTHRDGFYESKGGFGLENQDKDEIILYSKINALNQVIEGYDELKISSLEKKRKRTDEIDYSKIHNYMHKAIYLDNDVLYIDEMNLSKSIIIQSSPPLLQLFSFIFTEIKKELQEFDSIPDKAFELADIFKDNYLQPDSSLFGSEEMLNQNIGIMKEVLEDIEINTVYKDDDYWHFFDAVESFLYSEKSEEDGIYWGINSFSDVWEDMCQTYFLNKEPYKSNALFADINGRLEDFKKLENNPFEISLNKESTKRYLKPDLVIKKFNNTSNLVKIEDYFNIEVEKGKWIETKDQNRDNVKKGNVAIELLDNNKKDDFEYFLRLLNPNIKKIFYPKHEIRTRFKVYNNAIEKLKYRLNTNTKSYETDNNCIQIIDYKYMAELAFHNYNEYSIDIDGENKINDDIKKQLIYEWAVQNSVWHMKTESEFWIPYFDDVHSEQFTKKHIKINNNKFNESQIKVVKIPFNVLQDFYLKNWFND
jgi:hypothetical protein